jgi:hypothetical protein
MAMIWRQIVVWPDRTTYLSTLKVAAFAAVVTAGFLFGLRQLPPDLSYNPAHHWSLWKAGAWVGGICGAVTFPLAWAHQLAVR